MKAPFSIPGLSRFAREVSRLLLRGYDPLVGEVLSRRVQRSLELLDRILLHRGLSLEDLAPSQRRAYTFLRQAAGGTPVSAEPAAVAHGRPENRYHALTALWDEVNQRHFQGELKPAVLRWSQRPSFRRLGFWDPRRDHIVISRSLDHPAIPAELIRYILFHEGLHKRLGIDHREGGRRFHTRTFHALEHTYPDWRRWERFLREEWPKLACA